MGQPETRQQSLPKHNPVVHNRDNTILVTLTTTTVNSGAAIM